MWNQANSREELLPPGAPGVLLDCDHSSAFLLPSCEFTGQCLGVITKPDALVLVLYCLGTRIPMRGKRGQRTNPEVRKPSLWIRVCVTRLLTLVPLLSLPQKSVMLSVPLLINATPFPGHPRAPMTHLQICVPHSDVHASQFHVHDIPLDVLSGCTTDTACSVDRKSQSYSCLDRKFPRHPPFSCSRPMFSPAPSLPPPPQHEIWDGHLTRSWGPKFHLHAEDRSHEHLHLVVLHRPGRQHDQKTPLYLAEPVLPTRLPCRTTGHPAHQTHRSRSWEPPPSAPTVHPSANPGVFTCPSSPPPTL